MKTFTHSGTRNVFVWRIFLDRIFFKEPTDDFHDFFPWFMLHISVYNISSRTTIHHALQFERTQHLQFHIRVAHFLITFPLPLRWLSLEYSQNLEGFYSETPSYFSSIFTEFEYSIWHDSGWSISIAFYFFNGNNPADHWTRSINTWHWALFEWHSPYLMHIIRCDFAQIDLLISWSLDLENYFYIARSIFSRHRNYWPLNLFTNRYPCEME